jgi:phosphatidylserine decarboxylase
LDGNKINSFNKFFTREFKEGIRKFEGEFLSPAESVLSDYGLIEDNLKLEIKGMHCGLSDLIGENYSKNLSNFGLFYLSPADYHRVHAPFDMDIKEISFIDGDLYSVKPSNVENINDLFCKNKRVVLSGSSKYGEFSLVLIGALVVGRIVLSFDKEFCQNGNNSERVKISIKKGDEVGQFELGSTVIVFVEKPILNNLKIAKGKHILVGSDLLY